MRIEEPKTEPLQFVVHVGAKLDQNPLAECRSRHRRDELECRLHDGHDQYESGDEHDARHRRPLGGRPPTERPARRGASRQKRLAQGIDPQSGETEARQVQRGE